jgi:oxygen-independent coproporphyrinogen-3 oxidase
MIPQPTLEQMREELRVSEEFLARYNRPGPRYTSYPTAPVWNDAFGPADLEAVHAMADAARTPVSLYMHLPFCESLCLFCACNVIIKRISGFQFLFRSLEERDFARQRVGFARAWWCNSTGVAEPDLFDARAT